MPKTGNIYLMRTAAFDALERLHGVGWQRDIETFYPPLSETLVWITALAEALGRTEEPRLSGLIYARNCTLHGAVVVSEVSTQGPFSYSPLKGSPGNRFIGSTVAYIWGFTDDPEPLRPGERDRTPKRRADYGARVARHEVFPLLDRVLSTLGVNVWEATQGDLTPRKPRRQTEEPSEG